MSEITKAVLKCKKLIKDMEYNKKMIVHQSLMVAHEAIEFCDATSKPRDRSHGFQYRNKDFVSYREFAEKIGITGYHLRNWVRIYKCGYKKSKWKNKPISTITKAQFY